MPDLSPEDYERAATELMRLAAGDFQRSVATEEKDRVATCRYFRRGADAGFSHTELIDFLGVSTPSVLDMAGYPDAAAQRVMAMLGIITDEQIQSAKA
jgi:N-acetyl-beta-hexosaminidase